MKGGFARKLTENEAARITDKTNYIPHHHVFNKNKPESSESCSTQRKNFKIHP